MSSGGWELVGRSKKDKNNGKINKLTKAEKKKFIENAPKVEDFRKHFFLIFVNFYFYNIIIFHFFIISVNFSLYNFFYKIFLCMCLKMF